VAMKTKELEISEKIERRLEMIHAHTKLEKKLSEKLSKNSVYARIHIITGITGM
jgi:hypothetical protein